MICDFLGFNYWDDGTQTLANRLRIYRIENKLTQSELGNLIGINARCVERIEAGGENVSLERKEIVMNYIDYN